MHILSIASLVGAASLMAGCSRAPWGRYVIPFEEARTRLEKADAIGFRNARACGFLIHFHRTRPAANTVGWFVTSRGRTVLRFQVSLTPTVDGVKAGIVVAPGASGGEMYDGNQAYDYPAVMQPLRPALQELVDAAMEQRPFDGYRLPGPWNVGPERTTTICRRSRDSLHQGIAWSMDDPPGMSPDNARDYRALQDLIQPRITPCARCATSH